MYDQTKRLRSKQASTLAVPEAEFAPVANGDALQGRARLNVSLDDTAPEADVPEAFEVSPTLSYQLIFY